MNSNSRHAFTSFILARYARSTSPKHDSAPNTRSNDFICSYLERVTSRIREKIALQVGDGGVAGEGRVIGVPKFHFWGKYIMSNEYQLRLDVQCFLWPVYCIILFTRVL